MAQTFTTDLVRRAIKSCRNSNAFGPDKLSIFHLEYFRPRDYRIHHRPLQPLSHELSDSGDMEVFIDQPNTETWQGHLFRCYRPHPSTEKWWRSPTTVSTHNGRCYPPSIRARWPTGVPLHSTSRCPTSTGAVHKSMTLCVYVGAVE